MSRSLPHRYLSTEGSLYSSKSVVRSTKGQVWRQSFAVVLTILSNLYNFYFQMTFQLCTVKTMPNGTHFQFRHFTGKCHLALSDIKGWQHLVPNCGTIIVMSKLPLSIVCNFVSVNVTLAVNSMVWMSKVQAFIYAKSLLCYSTTMLSKQLPRDHPSAHFVAARRNKRGSLGLPLVVPSYLSDLCNFYVQTILQ